MVPETGCFCARERRWKTPKRNDNEPVQQQEQDLYDGRITRGAPCRYMSCRKRDLESIRSCEKTGNTDTQALVRVRGDPIVDQGHLSREVVVG